MSCCTHAELCCVVSLPCCNGNGAMQLMSLHCMPQPCVTVTRINLTSCHMYDTAMFSTTQQPQCAHRSISSVICFPPVIFPCTDSWTVCCCAAWLSGIAHARPLQTCSGQTMPPTTGLPCTWLARRAMCQVNKVILEDINRPPCHVGAAKAKKPLLS